MFGIAQNATNKYDVGTYDVKLKLSDENNVTSLIPLTFKLTVLANQIIVEESQTSGDKKINQIDSSALKLTANDSLDETIMKVNLEK